MGENLGSVIERGLHKPVLATDVVGVVVEEVLREQARSGGFVYWQVKIVDLYIL